METTLITGANRGIGLGLAKRFLSGGHRVIATCRDPERAAELDSLRGTGEMEVLALDVTDESSVNELSERLEHERIDVLINNAGVLGDHRNQSLDRMDYDLWRALFEVNTLAPFRVLAALRNNLNRSDNPRVVTISARMASFGRTDTGVHAYRSTKAALNKLMQVLSYELKEEGIIVCCVHPGWVQTDMSGGTGELTVDDCSDAIHEFARNLEMDQSGRFWTWAGEELSW
ncbi:MAG: SDR family oxidoreductase [Pseudomonadota bacterium]